MIGKVPPEDLRSHVFSRTGASDDRVTTGPEYGEDAAGIDLGDRTLVVSSDPISLAAERVGTLGVHVACNDVAVSGADPAWLTTMIFLPDDDPALLSKITDQLDAAARDVGVSIVGGHSEYDPDRSRPLLALTAMGVTDRFVPTGGAAPGDRVIVTKGAGVEGTAILATDFRDTLLDAGVDEAVIERASAFFDDISVIQDARAVREYATAMHDPTEGGLVDGLLELAAASGVSLEVSRDSIPVRPETAALSEAVGVDPLRIFGSGALVATVPAEDVDAALDALSGIGVDAADVGRVTASETPALVFDDERFEEPVRDDLYALWE